VLSRSACAAVLCCPVLQLNKHQRRYGQTVFANTRNAASGSLRLLDPKEAASRHLSFLAYQLVVPQDKVGERCDAEACHAMPPVGCDGSDRHIEAPSMQPAFLSAHVAYVHVWGVGVKRRAERGPFTPLHSKQSDSAKSTWSVMPCADASWFSGFLSALHTPSFFAGCSDAQQPVWRVGAAGAAWLCNNSISHC
jgi:hypothetical protein